jgi:hypothetical protein
MNSQEDLTHLLNRLEASGVGSTSKVAYRWIERVVKKIVKRARKRVGKKNTLGMYNCVND